MQSPHPPRPPHPPHPGPTGESDRALLARLSGPDAARHHAVSLLLARHWPATRDHAVVCLAAAGSTAQLVAVAAFHEVLGRAARGVAGGALCPQLLVAVRDIVRDWAADDAACIALPELRKTTGGRGLRATNARTPERLLLAERAFHSLPGASQCLLWHTEVEAEPINIPAGLLGVDAVTATAALEQAREQFRAGCVRAHRELAPSRECRLHNRLLDVPLRRGGDLLPDVRRHLAACRHCRLAAEQLGRFEDGLGLLLAEAVLGWGARRYLDSRPGRGIVEEWPPPAPEAAHGVAGGRHRTGPERRHRTGPVGPRRKGLVIGVGLTTLALLATVLVARTWSDDGGVPVPGAAWGAPAGHTTHPHGTGRRHATSPSAASAGEPVEIAHGGLRSLASGRCLDVRGGRITAGAAVRLAVCSSTASQQWSYQDDGLLRSAADPTLCLAADPGSKSVLLDGCLVHAGEVSYDLTLHGEILLRGHKGLALAQGSDGSSAEVEVADRDGAAAQRWVLEPDEGGQPSPTAAPDAPGSPGGGAGKAPGQRGEDGSSSGGSGREGRSPGEYGETRVAQVAAPGDRLPPGRAAAGAAGRAVDAARHLVRRAAGTLGSPVARTAASVPPAVGSLLG
ncbi:RICIN domain-containing protein [Streptomyces sp. NPDC004561]